MSVKGYPRGTRVQPSVAGSNVSMAIDFETHEVPPGIDELLLNMGYKSDCHDPDTNEQLYSIDVTKRPQETYPLTDTRFKWYEALAYEFANFLTIGNAR